MLESHTPITQGRVVLLLLPLLSFNRLSYHLPYIGTWKKSTQGKKGPACRGYFIFEKGRIIWVCSTVWVFTFIRHRAAGLLLL